MREQPSIRVLCVDDNRLVGEAIERAVRQVGPPLAWAGWAANADRLLETIRETRADVVLLDVDMPGVEPIGRLAEISEMDNATPARVVMLSGHVRPDHINRAIEAGAWGYLSKHQPMDALLQAIRRVHAGEFMLSPEVQAVLERS